jgi:hypothetical protein
MSKTKDKIKIVLYDIIVHELKTNNVDEIDILIKAITFKIDNYKDIVEAIYAEIGDDLDYDRIKDVAYDLIF